MELRLLGPVEAWIGARRLDLGPRKQRFILAVLALEANSTVTVDRLVQLAWPVSPPRTAAHAVRVCVSGLRAVLAGAGDVEVARHGHGYALLIDPARIDVHRFRELLAGARAEPRDDRRVALLTEALALWSGPPLAGVAPAESREQLCQGIEEARLSAVEERLDALLRLGQHRDLVDELIGLVTAYPLRQRFVGQLMLALHRSGQTGEALARYRSLRGKLVEAFGLDPGADLQQLERAILRGAPEADAPPSPRAVAAAVAPVPRELPPDVYAFAGRRQAMSALDGVLTEAPDSSAAIALVTGTGGVGKTALAVHWGHRVAGRFPDGQLYLDLRGFHPDQPIAPEQALAALLSSLGVSGPDLPTDRAALVGRYRTLLADRRVLLLLDTPATPNRCVRCCPARDRAPRSSPAGTTSPASSRGTAPVVSAWMSLPRKRRATSCVPWSATGSTTSPTPPALWSNGAPGSRWHCGSRPSSSPPDPTYAWRIWPTVSRASASVWTCSTPAGTGPPR